jgi:hypothetical protein
MPLILGGALDLSYVVDKLELADVELADVELADVELPPSAEED